MIEPLTDEQLKILLAVPLDTLALQEMERTAVSVLGIPITRLVAEVRRLRAPVANADIERVLENALGDMEMNEHERCVGEKEHAVAQAQQDDLRTVVRSGARELERLRSDEWLEAAAKEINKTDAARQWGATEPIVEILRKHRDGKA